MSDAILAIEWSDALVRARTGTVAEAESRRVLNRLTPAVPYVSGCDWLWRLDIDKETVQPASIEPDLVGLIAIVVSQDNSCRHCYGAWRSILQIMGWPVAQIERLEGDLASPDLPAGWPVALEYARQLSRANPRPENAGASLRAAGFTPEQIAEITMWAGIMCIGNRMATLLALPPSTELESLTASLPYRLLRPLFKWWMRRNFARKAAQPLTTEELASPFATSLRGVQTAPGARVLLTALEGAARSTLLPPGVKGLMVAVIGRALGCATCEQAGRAAAAATLDPDVVDEAVMRLGSRALRPEEELLLHFARSSVRYKPIEAQRLTRSLLEHYDEDQVVEAIGVCALANGTARLTVAASAC